MKLEHVLCNEDCTCGHGPCKKRSGYIRSLSAILAVFVWTVALLTYGVLQ